MNRRSFKVPTLRQLRAHERGRIQQRLQALTGDEQPSEHSEDTREFVAQQADLSPERGAPAHELLTQPSNGVRAGLYHLNGASFAELPCDNLHGVIVLGRGETATVRIDDAYVHRVHAHLRWDAEGKVHIIAHGGGENGTYVNRKRISEPTPLSSGARIRLGRSEFIYKLQ